MKDYVRLVVSDTHLGSDYSKEEELLSLLKGLDYDELILAGDRVEFLRVNDISNIFSMRIRAR